MGRGYWDKNVLPHINKAATFTQSQFLARFTTTNNTRIFPIRHFIQSRPKTNTPHFHTTLAVLLERSCSLTNMAKSTSYGISKTQKTTLYARNISSYSITPGQPITYYFDNSSNDKALNQPRTTMTTPTTTIKLKFHIPYLNNDLSTGRAFNTTHFTNGQTFSSTWYNSQSQFQNIPCGMGNRTELSI